MAEEICQSARVWIWRNNQASQEAGRHVAARWSADSVNAARGDKYNALPSCVLTWKPSTGEKLARCRPILLAGTALTNAAPTQTRVMTAAPILVDFRIVNILHLVP